MDPAEIVLDLPLRTRDVDQLGHVNQAVYHELLEEGRIALFRRARPDGYGLFVLARVELDYKREVRLTDGPLRLALRVDAVGRSSVDVHHELRLADGTLAAEGRSVLVAWDPEARRARALTDGERAGLGGDQAAARAATARSA